MIVYVVHSESALGSDRKELSFMQLVFWLSVLTRNKVPHRIEYIYERGPKQYEFAF